MTALRCALLIVVATGCDRGQGEVEAPPAPDIPSADVAPPPGCPAGTAAPPQGACAPVGIQGCATSYLGADALCRPRSDACAPGTIPKLEGGCVPVGIPACAALFRDVDGLCRPDPKRCAAGTIPRIAEGCAPVGPAACAPIFLGEDGICRPRASLCPADSFPVPSLGCLPLDDCGTGRFGAIADSASTIYVDPAWAGPANGTRDHPATSLTTVLADAPDGATIALAAGIYAEAVHVTRPLHLVGRCASLVRLAGAAPTSGGLSAAVWFDAADGASLSGVTIGGSEAGVHVDRSSGAIMDHVHISGAANVGVLVSGKAASVTIRRSLIEGTVAGTGTWAEFAGGVEALDGGRFDIEQSALVANRGPELTLDSAGTTSTVADSLLDGTGSVAPNGVGVLISTGTELELTDVVLAAHADVAMVVQGKGASGTLTRCIVAGAPGAASNAIGVAVTYGGQALVLRSALAGNRPYGLVVQDETSRAEVRESWIAETLPGTKTSAGLYTAGELTVLDTVIASNVGAGLQAATAGAKANVLRTVIADTYAPASGVIHGVGVLCSLGAEVELAESAVLRSGTYGVVAAAEGSRVSMRDALIEGMASAAAPKDSYEFGLGATAGGRFDVSRTAIRQVRSGGAQVEEPSTHVTLTACLVEDIVAPDEDAYPGSGLDVLNGASMDVTGCVLRRLTGAALVARGEGTALSLTSSLVEDGRTTEAGALGIGVLVYDQATLVAHGSAVTAAHIAAFAVQGGTATIDECFVSGTLPGVVETADGKLHVDVADGVTVSEAGVAELSRLRIEGCGRAGVMYFGGSGTVRETQSLDNAFGLVLQGSPRPTLGSGNGFWSNAAEDISSDGVLPVDDVSLPTPPWNP